jgi:HK97 family phage major capsid protein
MDINVQLEKLSADFGAFMQKHDAEMKNFGKPHAETVAELKNIQERIDTLEKKFITFPGKSEPGLTETIKTNEAVSRIIHDKKGKAYFTLKGAAAQEFIESKTTVTSSTVGFPTSGVMPEDRGAYVTEPRKTLRMRDVIPSRPISVGQYSWPKYSNVGTKASPVAEAAQKPINTFDPTIVTERVKTIATFFRTGRQVLEDWSELDGILRSLGSYKYNAEMDLQILSGSNSGENLNGLITQATAYDGALLTAASGYTYFDQIAVAAQQVAEADLMEPTFFVVHPRNWWQMKRLKDNDKNYLLGGPTNGSGLDRIWGMTPIATTNISAGTFLVGSGTPTAAEFRSRMELEVAVSTEDADNFTYNLVTIRFEGRGLLAVYNAGAFITGTFANSPAQ